LSAAIPVRSNFEAMEGYHSPQVSAEVRLNTNESPFPPPEGWREAFEREVARVEANRYPDRHARVLREALAEFHGIDAEEIFCANGSNEVLQCLLLAFGGPGKRAVVFEPTYALHAHICRLTHTEVVSGRRDANFGIDPDHATAVVGEAEPVLTFLCSPNNPSGGAEPPSLLRVLVGQVPGLLVVDEAYGQFAPVSALSLRGTHARDGGPEVDGQAALVVVRTFSKTWSMAAARLGYLVGHPEVVAGCEQAALPYHLSAYTQAAGVLALRYRADMEARVALIASERDRVTGALATMAVQTWHSDANFVLFRPLERPARKVWEALLEHSVLIRDFSTRPGLEGCLRVSIGTPAENDRFLAALEVALR